MADKTTIEWTGATWNPITGCSVLSPGCTNCYAMRLAGGRLRNHPSRAGLTKPSKAGPVWNGQVRFNQEWLTPPLKWKTPRKIFVCAHGDLFHEHVRDEWLDRIFAVMALAPQHTFQVLTKRPERMREYIFECGKQLGRQSEIRDAIKDLAPDTDHRTLSMCRVSGHHNWKPLPNVWFGVSVEDQQRADERIPVLLDTPAALRWVSAEPLLEEVDFSPWLFPFIHCNDCPCPDPERDRSRYEECCHDPMLEPSRLDWIVAGGESGAQARPFDIAWARNIIAQCKAAGVPVFMKQCGARVYDDSRKDDMPAQPEHASPEDIAAFTRGFTRMYLRDKKGGTPAEWPDDLRVREYPVARVETRHPEANG